LGTIPRIPRNTQRIARKSVGLTSAGPRRNPPEKSARVLLGGAKVAQKLRAYSPSRHEHGRPGRIPDRPAG
jgi:hypothetical protein